MKNVLFLLLCFLIVLLPGPSKAAKPLPSAMPPFFLMGDGRLHLKDQKTGREIRVNLLTPDGAMNEKALLEVDGLFGLSFQERGEHISPRMLFMLDYFSDRVAPGKVILLHSGYRSPEYNRKLKAAGNIVANTSLHLDGMALDFSIEGVNGKQLWERIRQENCCGIGHYGGNVLHLDAGRPRFWEAVTAGVTTGQSDFNRRIYLSTEYDRYAAGQRVRLFFTAASDFGFGVRPQAALVAGPAENEPVSRIDLESNAPSDCLFLQDRKAARFVYLVLPTDLAPGRYRFRLDFCRRPFEQMPEKAVSNEIEIVAGDR